MKWEKVRLGDCCTKIGSGSTPKGGSTVYIGEGVALIRSQNVYNLSFDYSGLVFINSEAAEKLNGVKIEPNDILLNITGDSVARTCLVPIEVIPARVNQHVSIIRPQKNVLDATFLSYYLASPFMQSFMLGLAVGKGTSRNAMTKDMISNFEIPCPTIAIQKKIASILKSYDDLIENNQKQIKLLEEAAQRLYKEWFVDLRFPGHESVKIVEGVPEGWSRKQIFELGKIITGKTPNTSKQEYYGGSIPFVKIPDMHNCIYTISTESTLTKLGADKQKNNYIPENSIMVSCIGTVGLVNISSELCQTNQQINSIVLKNREDVYYLFFSMKMLKTLLDGVGSNGATMINVNKSKFSSIEILYPNDILRNKYFSIAKPYFRKIYYLSKQISSLREARDRLLPKLMNSEIEV